MRTSPFTWLAATAVAATLSTASATAQTSRLEMEIEPPAWDFGGDFRFRSEHNDNVGTDRHRQRLRLRFGGTYNFNDRVTLGARLISGNADDPNSPHVDLGSVLNSLDVSLDRLYFAYRPAEVDGLTVVGGKFGNPVTRNPIYGELVWDADVQPEGVGFVYSCTENDIFEEVRLYGAQVAVLEQSGGEESWATLVGFDLKKQTGDNSSLMAGASYSHYGDLTPDGSTGQISGDLRGNALTGSETTSDFGILDAVLALNFDRFTVSGELINNLRAEDGVGDTGFALGGAVKTDAGKVYYTYASMEQDAILTAVSQDDFNYIATTDGSEMATNFNTHVFGWKIPLSENSNLNIMAMASSPNEVLANVVDETVYRFRIDWNLGF